MIIDASVVARREKAGDYDPVNLPEDYEIEPWTGAGEIDPICNPSRIKY